MKNIDIVNLHETLKQYAPQLKELKGAKFAYAILKNSDRLAKESKLILDARNVTPGYTAFEQARIAICERFSAKNDDGTAKTRVSATGSTEYDLDQENPEFKQAMIDLREANADVLAEQNTIFTDFNKMLQSENESFQLHLLSIEDVPEEIGVELMSVILPLIKE